MTSDRSVRHLRPVPTLPARPAAGPGRGAGDALPAALRFLALLGERPIDVQQLRAWVPAASLRGWADWQAATGWVAELGDFIHGPLFYCQTDDSTLAYLPIYRRTGATSAGPHAGAGRPAGMLTLRRTPKGRQWQVHGLTTL